MRLLAVAFLAAIAATSPLQGGTVTFPTFAKVVTKAGEGQSPIYAFLGKGGQLPAWNFGKYLVGRDGKVIAYFPSKVAPESKELRDAIETALGR